jgi:hypothetical protein
MNWKTAPRPLRLLACGFIPACHRAPTGRPAAAATGTDRGRQTASPRSPGSREPPAGETFALASASASRMPHGQRRAATSDGRLAGLLEGHDLIPPRLHRGEDGLLVFLLDVQLLERCLQMPDHLVERLLGDVEIGVGFV